MIDVNIFVAIEIIGGVLVIAGVILMNPKGTRANLSLLVLLVGVAFLASGLCIGESKSAKGTSIKFLELKDQKYLSKEVPQNWRLVQIDSVHFQKKGWKIIKDFPALFDFSAKKFTKHKEEATYPNK